MAIKSLIRTIPDYPKPGIMFRDITTLIGDSRGFQAAIDELVARYDGQTVDKVVAIEARGFIIGAPIAHQLRVGFVPIRKKGKLPGDTIEHHYDLEYGTDTVEIHTDAVTPGQKVLVVDDLIATGGTAIATITLLRQAGADIAGASFVVDLPDLGGRKRLEAEGVSVLTLVEFEGE